MKVSVLILILLLDKAKSILHLNSLRTDFQSRINSRSRDQFEIIKLISIQGGQRSALDEDYDEPYVPPNEDDDSSPSSANIQFMITNRMRFILENELGYLPEEVDEMEPQIVRQNTISFFLVIISGGCRYFAKFSSAFKGHA